MSATKPETFVECFDAYFDDCNASGQSPTTVRIKKCNLNLFHRWCISEGIKSPYDLTKKDLERYKRYLNTYINPRSNKRFDTTAFQLRRCQLTQIIT